VIDALQLWSEIATASPGQPGVVRRRILPDSSRDIYLAVAQPAQEQMLILRISPPAAPDAALLPSTKAIRIAVLEIDDRHSEIRVSLLSSDMLRVFASFVEDVATFAGRESSDEGAIAAFVARFALWRRLLAGEARGGLSREEAQGLWAEMWILGNVLQPIWAGGAVRAWTGYDRDDKDFRSGHVAVEVKSTRADAPHAVRIHSAGQLDAGDAAVTLLLAVLEVDAHEHGAGETLNDSVARTRRLVGAASAETLDRKLETYGYHDADLDLYAGMRFTLSDVRWFRVETPFPRIVPEMLPDGVGRVTYLVSVDACAPWRIDDGQLGELLSGRASE
jgi:hypothetical protein